jgi:hypothetical protein
MFVMAIDAFKRVNNKTFPTWTDVLEVIRKLGYRKTMPSELKLGKRAEDWTERADAPCGVFKLAKVESRKSVDIPPVELHPLCWHFLMIAVRMRELIRFFLRFPLRTWGEGLWLLVASSSLDASFRDIEQR